MPQDPETDGLPPGDVRVVFVVDRDVQLRKLLVAFLAPLKCKVEFFDDGYAALDAIRLHPPRLVVTDVLVPRLDGLALCRLVKRDEKLRGVKVVILSAVSAEERARQSHADAFLEKPIEGVRVLSLVQELTNLRSEDRKR